MNHSLRRHRHRIVAWVLAASTAAPMLPASAQPKPAAPPAAATNKPPLDALDESQLMSELANRGLNNLLDYYFHKNHVPDDKRKEIVVLIALKHLDSPDFSRKSAADRKKEIDDIVAGINNLLPTITDPSRLLRYASALITNGTLRLVNILDYWGDNPKTQAALNPIAETVDKILERAVTESKAKSEALLGTITAANDPRIKLWEEADQIYKLAEYNRARSSYGLAMSYDKAAVAKREAVCARAIAKLTEFDEEGSNVRVPVELEIAKLNMARGGEGYAKAREYFKKVIDAKPDDAAKNPRQYVGEQYQARYFTLVADVLNHKAGAAAGALPALKSWQLANLPSDKATQQGLEAAMSMLEYRITSGMADAKTDPKERDKLNNEAVSILMDLVNKRPDLRSIIFEQVMSKLPENEDLTTVNSLLLEAMVTRGIEAIQRKTPEKDDAKNIQIAADAARQILVKKKTDSSITSEQADSSAFRIGVFEEHIGSTPQLKPAEQFQNKLDAANAYVTYVEEYGANKEWSNDAMDNALSLLVNLRRSDANNAEINKLYDRALDIALFKKGLTQVALAYAQRQREKEDFAAAKRGYSLVKSDVPIVNVLVKYFQMLCDQQLLTKAPEGEKAALSAHVQKLADELNPLIDKTLAAGDPKIKDQLLQTRARMVLLAADVARSNKNSARVVEMLNGYENLLTQFKPEVRNVLLGNALFLRVNALMALGRNSEALGQIDSLVANQTPEQSLVTITELLRKLNENFLAERGKTKPDPATLQQLSGQQAELAQLLVRQVQKNANLPEENRREYLTFNANAQRQAAELEQDPAKKSVYLTQAMTTYEELLKGIPENDPTGKRIVYQRLIALTQFTLGDPVNLRKAHDTLDDLIGKGFLGGPMVRVKDTDEAKPNDIYWEAVLRLLQAKVKLNDPALRAEAERILKNLVIQHGDKTGGANYAKFFKELRTEILGNWEPAK